MYFLVHTYTRIGGRTWGPGGPWPTPKFENFFLPLIFWL
jgi:hypothetical protein